MATIESVRPMFEVGMLLSRKDIYGYRANLDSLDAKKSAGDGTLRRDFSSQLATVRRFFGPRLQLATAIRS